MSCFESSTFVKNIEVMNQEVLQLACDKLGWRYAKEGNALVIYDIDSNINLRGEYAMKIVDNKVTYNTYYLRDAKFRVNELKTTFYELNVKYAEESIIREFKKVGYTYKSNEKFKPNGEEVISFYMVGRSKLKEETESIAQIKFTILKDGSIVTDSNYIPKDIHELADQAMEKLEEVIGTKREIRNKEIPLKYKNKAFCAPKETIKAKKK